MLASQRSLASTQLSRNTLAELAEARVPLREAALEAFRRRNAVLDALFYDVGKVSSEEARAISPWLAREGSVLIVPPSGAGTLRLCSDLDTFFENGGRDIRILSVAGVGSSALGSAAFARNVADAFGQPAAAVVSGYGLADLITEAAGGWFWFGALNGLRHQFEQLDAISRPASPTEKLNGLGPVLSLDRLSLDTKTVSALLTDPRSGFSLLTGHSKGNLVLSEALYELGAAGHELPETTWIVTISAAVVMPPRFHNTIIDVMGDIDWFGALNSRPDLDIEKKCHLAWHHTNTELWFHVPVTKVFTELVAAYPIVI